MTTIIGKWIIVVACIVSVIIGLTGNFLIILVRVVKQIKRQNITAYTFLVCQLAVADFLFAFTLVFDISFSLKNNNWEFGLGLCKFIKTLQSTSLSATVGFLMVMAYERFLGISNPLRHRWSIKKTTFLVIGVWIYIILTMVPFFLALGISKNECYDVNYSSTSFIKGYTLFLFITNYVLPLFFIIIFHSMIVKRLHVHMKTMAAHTHRSRHSKSHDATQSLNRSSSRNKSNKSENHREVFSELRNFNKKLKISESSNSYEKKQVSQSHYNNHNHNIIIHNNNNNAINHSDSCNTRRNNHNENNDVGFSYNSVFNNSNNGNDSICRKSNKNSRNNSNTSASVMEASQLRAMKRIIGESSSPGNKNKNNKTSILSSLFKWFFGGTKHASNDSKVIKMLLAVTLCFSLMTLPTQIWYIWDTFSLEHTTSKVGTLHFFEVLSSLVYLHCCTNCIIYSVMDKRFRKDVSVLFLSFFRRRPRSSTFYSKISSTFSHRSIKRLYSNVGQNEYKEEFVVIEKETVLD